MAREVEQSERKYPEIIVTSRGRFIYECSCGASNGSDIRNLDVTNTLYECGGCNKGILITAILEKYRIAREVHEGRLLVYISQGL